MGIIDPSLSDEILEHEFISLERMRYTQLELNPHKHEQDLWNKANLHARCLKADIKTPKVFAEYKHGAPCEAFDGTCLNTREDWCAFIERTLPDVFIAKPAIGHHGEGVRAFERKGDAFVDQEGSHFSSAAVYEHLARIEEGNSVLIQERLRNHAELERLSGSQGLQTMRVTSLVRKDGTVLILPALHKVIVGDGVIDNLKFGETQNLSAQIDCELGVLGKTVGYQEDGIGFVEVSRHPVTGIEFAGFSIPSFKDVYSLVERAALEFLPLRTVGWDVAITPEGPAILEGNLYYDPPIPGNSPRELLEALREEGV